MLTESQQSRQQIVLNSMKQSILVLLSLISVAAAACPDINLGHRAFLKETTTSVIAPLVYDLHVLDQDERKIGKIHSRIFKLSSTMVLSNTEGQVVATAKARYISWGSHISFYNCEDKLIGKVIENSVKRRVLSGESSQTYNVEGSEEELLAQVSKLDTKVLRGIPLIKDAFHAIGLFKTSNFQMKSVLKDKGEVMDAQATRKFADGWRDDWTINYSNHTTDLKRLMFLFLPAYRTRMDSVLSPESSQELGKKRKLYEEIYQD